MTLVIFLLQTSPAQKSVLAQEDRMMMKEKRITQIALDNSSAGYSAADACVRLIYETSPMLQLSPHCRHHPTTVHAGLCCRLQCRSKATIIVQALQADAVCAFVWSYQGGFNSLLSAEPAIEQ